MSIKLFLCLPVCRNLCFGTLTHFPNINAPSNNLFLHFVTTRFNISSSDAAKILKRRPSLERLKTLDKVERVVDMLKRHGYSEDQIANVISFRPSVLLCSERELDAKIQVLKDSGVGFEVIAKFPRVLGNKLENLRSNLELLKTVFPAPDILTKAIANSPYILGNSLHSSLKPSLAFWEDFGFRGTELIKFMQFNPRVLMRSSLTPEQRDLIRKISIHKEKNEYKYIVGIVAVTPIEVLEARINNLQRCGLSPEEALRVVRANPLVFNMREETLNKKLDFMVNHMGLSVDFVTKRPRMFSMSLDKVMRPRFSVVQNMIAMDGTGEVNPTQLLTILMMNEAKFVRQIIEGHPESTTLWTVYKSATAKVSKA